jgi:poly(ADP-ribose) glycohydrolase
LDFANKYLGGGVLGSGCVQEEIRFLICPELIVSMLFTERLNDNESMIIKGVERFSSYTGYGRTFNWHKDYVDETPRDEWRRLYTHILAIDAIKFSSKKAQFKQKYIKREIIKCLCGFSQNLDSKMAAVATGNWGCGVFLGDIQLKFLIQLMAASEADRDLVYFTFNDQKTFTALNEMVKVIFEEHQLNIGEIYQLINDYSIEIAELSQTELKKFSLLEFMKMKLDYY